MALTKINASVIANNTIAVGNIADNSVDATKIASNSILTRHIDDDQITGDQLADNISIAGTLTSAGDAKISNVTPRLILEETDVTDGHWDLRSSFGVFKIRSLDNDLSTSTDCFVIAGDGDTLINGGVNHTTAVGNTNLEVLTTNSQAANLGGSIGLGGVYNATNQITFAEIHGKKTNSTAANVHGYMAFVTRGDNIAERMRIDSTGKVGIGTTSPAFTLHVLDTIGTRSLSLGHGVSTGTITTDSAKDLNFQQAGTTKMTLDDAGKLGIGTTSPDYPVEIEANNLSSGLPQFVVKGKDNDLTGIGLVAYGSNASHRNWGIAANQSVAGAFNIGYTANATNAPSTGNITSALLIDSAGNVGIGTTSPSKKLAISSGGAQGIELSPEESGVSRIFSYNRSSNAYTSLNTQGLDLRFGTGTSNTERMRIDSNGYQTNTNCRFQAKRSGSGNQGSTVHVVVFDSEDFDIGGNYNTSDGNFTAPVTGHYFFYYHHMNHQSANAYGTIYLDLNGSTYHYTHTVGGHPAGTTLNVTVPMTAGNTVRIRANYYYYNASYRHALFGGYLLG